MKRLLCAALVLLFLPVCAVADDLDNFNTYAAIFGVPELSNGTANDNHTDYVSDGVSVRFTEENGQIKRILVIGDGLPFIRYCIAAIMCLCPDTSNFTYNCGAFLSTFIMLQAGQEKAAYTKEGYSLVFDDNGENYAFGVNR